MESCVLSLIPFFLFYQSLSVANLPRVSAHFHVWRNRHTQDKSVDREAMSTRLYYYTHAHSSNNKNKPKDKKQNKTKNYQQINGSDYEHLKN